jgi:hypothetical protein
MKRTSIALGLLVGPAMAVGVLAAAGSQANAATVPATATIQIAHPGWDHWDHDRWGHRHWGHNRWEDRRGDRWHRRHR